MNLMRFRLWFFALSLAVIIPGLWSLFRYGLRPAIDFTGGSLLEIKTEKTDLSRDQLQSILGADYQLDAVVKSGEQQYILRGKEINNEQKNQVLSLLQQNLGQVEALRFETTGPILGKELLNKTLTAILIASCLITLYVWLQFKELKFGVCAILAMFHDTFILLGSFSLLGHFLLVEVDVLFVTALLTTLSFSVHDTIVVYDRIRELKRKHVRYPLETIANAAVLETLGRSINNSLTIIVMLLSLVMLGGETIKWFAVALLIGAIAGTYSSTFTAVPLLLVWEKYFERKKQSS